MTDAP